VLAAEHLLRLACIHLRGQIVERSSEVIGDRFPGSGPLDQNGKVIDARAERVAEGLILFEPAPPLQQLLRTLLVLPEVRIRDALFYLREFVGVAGGVKDSSAGRRRGGRDLRTCGAVRRC
jgi:hypothetical protein